MKHVFLLTVTVVIMVATGANAQNFNKGDWFLGAQSTGFDFKSHFKDGDSVFEFNLSVVGGRFFTDKFAVDAIAGIDDYVKLKGFDAYGAFNFGAGVRYYPVGNLFARLGYNGLKGIGVSNDNLISYLNVKVGYDIFLSEKVFFEPAVYYEKNINKDRGENILGFSIGLGVKF